MKILSFRLLFISLEYRYTYMFDAVNYYSSPVTLSWRYKNPNQNFLSTKSPREFSVQSTQAGRLDFVSKVPLSYDELRSALVLQAKAGDKPVLMVNSQERYNVILQPSSVGSTDDASRATPEKIAVSEKGIVIFNYN